jgi:Fe-S cluster biogenesis protein NfuA
MPVFHLHRGGISRSPVRQLGPGLGGAAVDRGLARYRRPLPVLDEPVAHAALVLGEEHAAQFREASGRIVEHSQKIASRSRIVRATGACSASSATTRTSRVIESGLVEEPCKVEHVIVTHGNAGDHHAGDATKRCRPTSGGDDAAVTNESCFR